MHPKNTVVLMVGMTLDSWRDFSLGVKDILLTRDMAWGYESMVSPTFHVAFRRVFERKDLQIVYLKNELNLSKDVLERSSEVLARQMAQHENRPWIVFGGAELDHLAPIFVKHGVTVHTNTLPFAVEFRWAAQNKQLAHAAE